MAVIQFGIYASDGYLAQHGLPDFTRGCEGHVLIGLTEELTGVPDRDWLPAIAARARVAVRTNGREPMATMAVAGIGITCIPRVLGDATPGLRRLVTPVAEPRRQLWVGVHREARKIPRIQAALAFVIATFERLRRTLEPSTP